MPELPEAERARQVLHDSTRDLIITKVETTADEIVFVDLKEGAFESTLIGRSVVSAERKGKLFWLNLSGKGKHPVFHLGMTGMIQLKGGDPVLYQSRSSGEVWPPKFWKFIIHLSPPAQSSSSAVPVQIAYLDPRRLGRIRLVQSPSTEPPVSLLGPDPILCPPTIAQLSLSLLRRKSPIKSVLLDQSVAAGVGNWVADEILYQSSIHPLTLSSSLSLAQITLLRDKMIRICTFAVSVGADSRRFPKEWLFGVRWGKGKGKKGEEGVLLPDGSHAKVEFITIGGRTSAFVPSIQLPPSATNAQKPKAAPKPKPTTTSEPEPKAAATSKPVTATTKLPPPALSLPLPLSTAPAPAPAVASSSTSKTSKPVKAGKKRKAEVEAESAGGGNDASGVKVEKGTRKNKKEKKSKVEAEEGDGDAKKKKKVLVEGRDGQGEGEVKEKKSKRVKLEEGMVGEATVTGAKENREKKREKRKKVKLE
ncbi:DNA glycosylase/AP lyase [Mrakia frigida]|uniref:DNA glycosylase/AP lyase n=1 Tax=Mrakia frigida TaxID=29902 RepID=UPI003FCC223C